MADGKQKVIGVISALIIVVAAVAIVWQLKPETYKYDRTLVDVDAKRVFQKQFTAGKAVEFPITSPFSEGLNGYPVYECNQDGTVFAYIPYTGEPGEEGSPPPEMMMPKCPTCGSTDVMVPQLPEGEEYIEVDQAEIPIVEQ